MKIHDRRFPTNLTLNRRAVEFLTLVLPVNTVAPVVSGTPGVGLTLTTTNGTWTGAPFPTFTYQWQRGDTLGGVGTYANIASATASTYDQVIADIGYSIRCVVTATNLAGVVSANSNAVLYNSVTALPETAIWVSTLGTVLLDSSTTVVSWSSGLGGITSTLIATGSRPAYAVTGGVGNRPLITTNGIDNVMKGVFTKGSPFTNLEMGVLGQRLAFVSTLNCWLLYEDDVSQAYLYGMRDLSTTQIRAGDTGADINWTTDPDGSNALWSWSATSGSWATRRNGTVEATALHNLTNRNDSEVLAFGARTQNGFPSGSANIAVQGLFFGPQLSTQQRLDIRALLQNYTGITT